MSKEQLDAVKDQLLSEDNEALKHSVFSAYLEEPERGANMIIAFATDKGLKLDAAPSEIVDYLDNLNDDEIDIEMTPEMLASVSGGHADVTHPSHLRPNRLTTLTTTEPSHELHGDRGLHPGGNTRPLQAVLKRDRIHHGGKHAHVVGCGAFHAGGRSLQSSENVAATHDDGQLCSACHDACDVLCN